MVPFEHKMYVILSGGVGGSDTYTMAELSHRRLHSHVRYLLTGFEFTNYLV